MRLLNSEATDNEYVAKAQELEQQLKANLETAKAQTAAIIAAKNEEHLLSDLTRRPELIMTLTFGHMWGTDLLQYRLASRST